MTVTALPGFASLEPWRAYRQRWTTVAIRAAVYPVTLGVAALVAFSSLHEGNLSLPVAIAFLWRVAS